MLAHESGEWEAGSRTQRSLHLDPEEVAGLYWQAQQWARELSNDNNICFLSPSDHADPGGRKCRNPQCMSSCVKRSPSGLARLSKDE